MLSLIETDKVTIRRLSNILDKSSRKTYEAEPWQPAAAYVPEAWRGDPGLRLVLSGGLLHADEWGTIVRPGEELVIYRVPGGIETLVVSIIVAIVVGGISYGISALTAPSVPGRKRDQEDSETYGWDGILNSARPGGQIPIVYGTHRVGGQILQQFQRQARNAHESERDPKGGELHTLLGLCAGPIAGVSSPRVNQNDIQDYGDSVEWEARLGTNQQRPLDGFHELTTSYPKDWALESGAGKEFTTQTSDPVDAFEIVFRFPAGLFRLSSHGGYQQKQVEFLIEYKNIGAATWEYETFTVSQKSANPFDAFYRSPWLSRARQDIRVTRVTPDDTEATGQSDVTIIAVDEIRDEILTYPNLALLAIRQLPTNQISGAPPTYDCLVKGRLVRVWSDETNYTTEWSDNPAWCLIDFLTDKTAGLGAYVGDAQIDLPAFRSWAASCDELVPIDAYGGTEKAYRLDIVLDGTLSAIEAIKQICASGRANFYLKGSKWSVRMEQEEEPVQLFSMGRILRDSYKASKVDRNSRANYLVGEYWDQDLDYEFTTLPREDPTLGVDTDQREKTISLVGTTRRSQAMRLLNYYMLANRLIQSYSEFEAGAEAIAMEAGDVFLLAHDVSGYGYSGMLLEVDTGGGWVILDRVVTIEAGKTYELTVAHDTDTIDTVIVTNNPETTNRISTSADWTLLPGRGTHYSFGEVTKSVVKRRCTGITRGSRPDRRKIRSEEYNPDVFGVDLTVLPAPSATRLQDPRIIPPDVTELRLQEREVYAEDGSLSIAIDVHFTLPTVPGVTAAVFWREVGDTYWELVGTTGHGYFSITENVESPGYNYEVSVVSVSSGGSRKAPADGVIATIATIGVTRQPDNCVGFVANRTLTGLAFSWEPLDPVRNFDLAYYEIREGEEWDTGVTVGKTTDTRLETTAIVKGTRTYFLKGFNTAGRASPIAATVIMVVDERIGENVIYTQTEDPTWPGGKDNFSIVSGNLVLQTIAHVVAWRGQQHAAPLRSQIIPGGYGEGFRVTGSYTTTAFQVGTDAVRCLVATDLQADQIDLSMYWDSPDLADKQWDSDFGRSRQWAVAPEGRVSMKVEMRFSTTDSADSSFGPWQERSQNIETTVKWAQARVLVTIRDPAFTVRLKAFRILFDVPDIVEGGTVTTADDQTVEVNFVKDFLTAPKIALTVMGATAGDEIFITNKDADGFDIEVKNSGSRVIRTVNYTAVGY